MIFVGYVLMLVLNGQVTPVTENIYPNLPSCEADKKLIKKARPMYDYECSEVHREKK